MFVYWWVLIEMCTSIVGRSFHLQVLMVGWCSMWTQIMPSAMVGRWCTSWAAPAMHCLPSSFPRSGRNWALSQIGRRWWPRENWKGGMMILPTYVPKTRSWTSRSCVWNIRPREMNVYVLTFRTPTYSHWDKGLTWRLKAPPWRVFWSLCSCVAWLRSTLEAKHGILLFPFWWIWEAWNQTCWSPTFGRSV